MASSLLELSALSYECNGHRLINAVNARLESGTRTLLLGPNGAGKSVLMRLCHGLLQPSAGDIRWHPNPPARQAMVFQRPVVLRRSVLANVTFALRLAGVSAKARRDLAQEALHRVGLALLADRHAPTLSGGERQQLALARAWAITPQVLFLDEPTANLDPGSAATVEGIIHAIHAAGTQIIMSTHNLGQARRLADQILFIDRGSITEHTPANEFFAAPRSHQAREFLSAERP